MIIVIIIVILVAVTLLMLVLEDRYLYETCIFFQGPMAASRPGRDRGTLPFSRTFHPKHVAFCHEASHLFAPRSSTAFGALLNTFLFNQKRLSRMNMSVIVIFELMLLLTKWVSYH